MPDRHASSGAVGAPAASARAAVRLSVLLPLPLAGVYDYLAPRGLALQPGDFVVVPLGNRQILGVAWGDATGDVPAAKLKAVIERLPAPPMREELRRLIDWVASYTLAPAGAGGGAAGAGGGSGARGGLRRGRGARPRRPGPGRAARPAEPTAAAIAGLAATGAEPFRGAAGSGRRPRRQGRAGQLQRHRARRRHRLGQDRDLFRGHPPAAPPRQAPPVPPARHPL